MRQREGTARRYAKALIDLARQSGDEEKTGAEIAGFSELISNQAELKHSLVYPWVKGNDKQRVAAAVAERLNYSKLTRNFLGLLAFRRRLEYLPEIIRSYQQLLDQHRGRVRAVVRTAVPLNASERTMLTEKLSNTLGGHVLLEERVDATLLGGFIVQSGSMVLDGSLDSQLARMREHLAKGDRGQ
jgi:F-type H+-transporting ATPase subunit delta